MNLTMRSLFYVLLCLPLFGCGGEASKPAPKEKSEPKKESSKKESPAIQTTGLKGEIKADGSSTVLLVTQAVSSAFSKSNPDVKISVGRSGTGGGFKKFAAGETDISNASRPIKAEEKEACAKNNIEYFEFQVAWDGLSVVINKENTWAKNMTAEQLKLIWDKDSKVELWSDVDPSWPKEKIKLFGAGTDSGTFDFFTEAINGKAGQSRTKYEPTEDDNVTVNGVSKDKYAMGYFGVAYYEENKSKLQVVAVAAKKGDPFVEPNTKTVMDKTYKPLSRPLYVYVKKASLKRPEVQEFLKFYLRRDDLVEQAKYIKMDLLMKDEQQSRLEKAIAEASK